jgi:hypothetical protein
MEAQGGKVGALRKSLHLPKLVSRAPNVWGREWTLFVILLGLFLKLVVPKMEASKSFSGSSVEH